MSKQRIANTIVISSDILSEDSARKRQLIEKENQLKPIWKRKPYSGTVAEPKGSGSEVNKSGLQ